MNNCLVSICVITYNSSKTVVDTLNSIKEQTYYPLELIVSDDCSTDDTALIVDKWISNNKNRFVDTEVILAEKNTGVTGNVNRAYKKARGVYVKDIAGDDLLLPEYVQNCVSFFISNPQVNVLFTKIESFNSTIPEKIYDLKENYSYFELSPQEQFEKIKRYGLCLLPTPSVIYTKSILEKVGYFDERIPMWEDGPMYFKLAEKGEKVYLLNKVLVRYRYQPSSLSNSPSYRHLKSLALYYKLYWFKYEIKLRPFKAAFHIIKYFAAYRSNRFFWRIVYNLTQLHADIKYKKQFN
jgi:alpha-1,3-rhamnosyltransferase